MKAFSRFKKIISLLLLVFIILITVITIVNYPTLFTSKLSFIAPELHSDFSFNEIKVTILDYLNNLMHGSLGTGNRGIEVMTLLLTGMPITLTLLLVSSVLSIIFGLLFGVFNSRKGKLYIQTIKLLPTLILLSMPTIFVIVALQSFFVFLFKHGFTFIPAVGFGTWRHLILPILCLSIIPSMYIARITSISMDNIYQQDYIRTALGKGASKYRIILRHVLRNTIIEVLDSFPTIISMIISNLLLVEYIFYCPGVILMMFNNITKPDVVIGVSLFLGVIFFIIYSILKYLKKTFNPIRES